MNRKPSSASERVLPINLNSARIADVDAPVCLFWIPTGTDGVVKMVHFAVLLAIILPVF